MAVYLRIQSFFDRLVGIIVILCPYEVEIEQIVEVIVQLVVLNLGQFFKAVQLYRHLDSFQQSEGGTRRVRFKECLDKLSLRCFVSQSPYPLNIDLRTGVPPPISQFLCPHVTSVPSLVWSNFCLDFQTPTT